MQCMSVWCAVFFIINAMLTCIHAQFYPNRAVRRNVMEMLVRCDYSTVSVCFSMIIVKWLLWAFSLQCDNNPEVWMASVCKQYMHAYMLSRMCLHLYIHTQMYIMVVKLHLCIICVCNGRSVEATWPGVSQLCTLAIALYNSKALWTLMFASLQVYTMWCLSSHSLTPGSASSVLLLVVRNVKSC